MGKLFAALIIAVIAAWLGPMCARLPADPVIAVAPKIESAPPVSTATGSTPGASVVPPALERPVTVSTYSLRKIFSAKNGQYVVSVLRSNNADVPALGVRMTLTTRMRGEIVESVESGPAQRLEAGSSSYFGLPVSTGVFDSILDGPEDRRSGLEWSLSYLLDGDAPGAVRCFRLRALPRRGAPGALSWLALGESLKCAP